MYGYIYKTTDLTNGKIYIGKKHSSIFLGIKYIGSGKIITEIKNKCIRDNIPIEDRLKVELLKECETLSELNDCEIYYINLYNSRDYDIGYNLRKGGDCGPGGPNFKGHRHSIETRLMYSLKRKGSGNSNYGKRRVMPEDEKPKHARPGKLNGMYGKHHSELSKNKITETKKNKIAISNILLDKVKMIYPHEFEQYLQDGWIIANIHKRKK